MKDTKLQKRYTTEKKLNHMLVSSKRIQSEYSNFLSKISKSENLQNPNIFQALTNGKFKKTT